MTMAFATNHRRQAGNLHFDLHDTIHRCLPMRYTERAQIGKVAKASSTGYAGCRCGPNGRLLVIELVT